MRVVRAMCRRKSPAIIQQNCFAYTCVLSLSYESGLIDGVIQLPTNEPAENLQKTPRLYEGRTQTAPALFFAENTMILHTEAGTKRKHRTKKTIEHISTLKNQVKLKISPAVPLIAPVFYFSGVLDTNQQQMAE